MVLVNRMQGEALGVSEKIFLLIEVDKKQAFVSFPLDI